MLVRTVTDIGRLVKERRRHLGWDQQRLADEVGVTRQWVIQFEKGKPRAAIELVLRSLRVLRLNLDVTPPKANTAQDSTAPTLPEVDLDKLIEKARGRKQ